MGQIMSQNTDTDTDTGPDTDQDMGQNMETDTGPDTVLCLSVRPSARLPPSSPCREV